MLIPSRVGADAAVKDKRKKDIIAANFKGALDAQIMIAKEMSDLENASKLRRGLEVPKYNVFTDTFYFKWTSNGAELMPCGTHGCALKSTTLPRLMGLRNNPGEGGSPYGVSEQQHADSMLCSLRKTQRVTLS